MKISAINANMPVNADGVISCCRSYLDSMGKINLNSINQLAPEAREYLLKNTPARMAELAKMNCYAAEKIKTKLDKEYGENNYILIAIGRSISSIVELIGHLGANIKIVPLSGLRTRDADGISSDNLHIYKTFLVQKGLSKTDLRENKDKTYILMDYTYYGRSLERAEKLFKKNELLGDAKNLIAVPVSKVLGKDYEKLQFQMLFQYCRFKDYSYVGKLNVDKMSDVYNQCSPERVSIFKGNITQGLRKLFWFNVFNSLQEKNFRNIIPNKELDAIYRHHLSLKAIRNYIKRENQYIKNCDKKE